MCVFILKGGLVLIWELETNLVVTIMYKPDQINIKVGTRSFIRFFNHFSLPRGDYLSLFAKISWGKVVNF